LTGIAFGLNHASDADRYGDVTEDMKRQISSTITGAT